MGRPTPNPEPGRILGVDPGSFHTGWGLICGTSARPRLIEFGVIRIGSGRSFSLRLHRLASEFEALLLRLRPSTAAVEAPFHGPNARAALQLAHARGVILAALGGASIPVEEYSPATVKKSVTGEGGAEKRQVQAMVGRLLGTGGLSISADAADALAVALCHLGNLGYRDAVSRERERSRR